MPKNGTPFAYQIPAYANLIAKALARDADQQEKQAAQDGVPLTVETEVAFIRAAAEEASNWHAS